MNCEWNEIPNVDTCMDTNMEKARRLKRDALKSCISRKHEIGNFFRPVNPIGGYHRFLRSFCKDCHMFVDITPYPLPNEVEIGGSAVAMSCKRVRV